MLAIQQCEFAKKMIERPKKVKILNLGDSINTSFPEYSPFVSVDGTALYFTSRRSWNEHSTVQFKDPSLNNFHEDIYVCYSDEKGGWSKPTRLEFCEDDRNEASISVSTDERRFFLYQDDKGNGDIFYTDYNSQDFEDIKPLKIVGVS